MIIKDISKIAHPLCKLLEKDAKFHFYDSCKQAIEPLKTKADHCSCGGCTRLDSPFEVMCDASRIVVGVVLEQKRNKIFHPIYYASKTLDDAQTNYTVTEREWLAVVYAFVKFQAYLSGTNSIVHTDHTALRYLMAKKMLSRG